jgi:hypothetical protein
MEVRCFCSSHPFNIRNKDYRERGLELQLLIERLDAEPHAVVTLGAVGDTVMLFACPLGRCGAGLPCLGDAAALLAQDLRVVGELVLEGKLIARVLPGVVEFGSPHGERA